MIIILGYFRVFVILTMIKGIKKENVCKFCIEGIQQCNMKNRDIYWRRYKIQETLYIGQWCPFKVGTLGPHPVLPNAARCSFCSGSRSCGTNFTMICFMPRSCIRISDTVLLGIPRLASSSHTVSCQPLMIAARTLSTFSGVRLLQAFQNLDYFQQILNHL